MPATPSMIYPASLYITRTLVYRVWYSVLLIRAGVTHSTHWFWFPVSFTNHHPSPMPGTCGRRRHPTCPPRHLASGHLPATVGNHAGTPPSGAVHPLVFLSATPLGIAWKHQALSPSRGRRSLRLPRQRVLGLRGLVLRA